MRAKTCPPPALAQETTALASRASFEVDPLHQAEEPYSVAARKQLKETLPVYLGDMLEWYEWSTFGYLANHIQTVFFPDDSTGTSVWMLFALCASAGPLARLPPALSSAVAQLAEARGSSVCAAGRS